MFRYIVLAPHQDDEVLGCGGTIALLSLFGVSGLLVFLTDGSRSHRHELGIIENPSPSEVAVLRKGEAIHAAAVLGFPENNIVFMDIENGRLEEFETVAAQKISSFIKGKMGPVEFILSPSPLDQHAEHKSASRICDAIVQSLGVGVDVYQYTIWGGERSIGPFHFYVDVTSTIYLKKLAMYFYKSQTTLLFASQTRPVLEKEFVDSLINVEKERFYSPFGCSALGKILGDLLVKCASF